MPSVLVIDDNPDLRFFVRKVLEPEGYQVREARNGSEGLCAYEQRPADVVLCGLFMPGQDGLEVIQHLQHHCPSARVVAMSGGSHLFSGDFLGVASLIGAVAILQKPFGRTDLLEAVGRGLAGN